MNKNLEDQFVVKAAIRDEFNLTEMKVSKSWLSTVDVYPDDDNPDHWDYLLHSKTHEIYVNLKWFPKITIEPTHTTSYTLGTINYRSDMTPEDVIWYIHNILDPKE